MIPSYGQKHFSSAKTRTLKAAFDRFFAENLPQIGGKQLRAMIIEKVIEIFDRFSPPSERLKPGQMLFVAVDKATRPDSRNVRFKPVTLTLITDEEIDALISEQTNLSGLLPNAIARITHEAYQQGALLSMRDIGLIFKRMGGDVSRLRIEYETLHKCVLPTTGSMQDMGTTLTHKALILKKILIEKKDMRQVRQETCHTQSAIDRYLKEYRRVEILLEEHKDIQSISIITGISKYVIKQYEIIYKEVKDALQNAA